MFGVDAFTPVINPPNVAILGVGRLRDEIALVDGRVEVTAADDAQPDVDHRVLDAHRPRRSPSGSSPCSPIRRRSTGTSGSSDY